ncbi:hypothetical protein GPY51_05235 [Photorhabdus laumondii subsp. laumondii]|uniref:Photorhabdus luminescens subsp. laumondii TTO1 complete genome segment 6/17 n=2 Tax=Photorhabdus laumondii subsp. laumondii TaxID=141679 RepID=Q7N684_PHOLL|nr:MULTISPECIES: hypothetical protein [Photorhabdus]AWK41522.1 hypothetical protein A4R40_08480 [Photorhabdus laumondii subsp. laumondii]AXG42322.1 hypothetical protein PluDJC_08680 [Photorhabdus laumondii subsp. laumondii]AXG46845.1 hypothetical protein PluTT01m_08700 [Photorhabdus laumondii subsp. laumondii]KTL61411.1 hypothetical protein AA106_08810 [Photorhabdus laumondii subsp. laumondii]MCC8382146.1 hypothetical protein [Photorhabdus laumondii]
MSKQLVVDGDTLLFEQFFGNRQVTILEPATIQGSGHAQIQNKKIAIVGDEKEVKLQAQYITPDYPTPGTGIVTIAQLDASQQANFCHSPAAVIIVGQQFTARFTPTQPANNPSSGPDVTTPSMGKGYFIASQYIVNAG